MKKLFTILALLMAFTVSGVAQEQDTWTVAGSAAALNGNASWDLSNTQNEMSSDDGVNYTLTVTNCTLEVGTTYEFKVVKGHSSWDEAYPSSNKSFTVNETAVYTVVYTFNATTHEVGKPTTTKTGEAGVITHTYTVAGVPAALFGEEWKPEKADNDMTLSSGLYTWTKNDVELVDDLSIAFKICVDHAWGTSYPSDNFVVNKNTDHGYDGAGTYDVTITFNESTKEVNATFVKQIENAEITSVQIFGSWSNWDSNFPINLEAGESNTYTGGIVIPTAKAEEFKLVVNGTWLGYDQVTLAGDYDFVSEGSDHNFKLSEAYQSYAITATWTPSVDASAGWTLTIVPGDERPKYTYTATFVNGANWENVYAYIWKVDGDNNVKLNGDYPGQKLVKSGTETISTVEYDVYTFTFETYDATAVPEFIVFSDGGSTNKTADLEFVNEKEYTETVPENATISLVLIHGAFASDTQWEHSLTLPLTGSENVYSQTVPLTTTLQDLVFELQVNGQNVRYNDVTIDPESTTGLLVDGGGNEHFILFKNSISGYDTYLATATWTPNPDPKAGWTLKVVGVHERTLDYAIVGDLTGGWPATTDDEGNKDVSMTAQNNGLYTLVVDEFAAEANTTYEYKLRTNKMWNLFDLPGNGNASWTPTEAGNYKLTFVANVTGAAITDDTFGEIPAYTVTLVPEKIVVSEDYYVIVDNGTKWVALGKMDYYDPMKEYKYNLDETWTGKYFAIAPASALNGDGDVVDWNKVVRPKTNSGDFLVEFRNYYDDVVIGGKNVWEKADEITRLSIHYYINVQDFALYPESDVTISDAGYATYSNKYDYFTVDAKVSIVKNVEGNKAVLEELEFLDGANKGISGGTGVILEKDLDETDVVTIYPYEKYADNEYVDVTGNMLIGSGNYTYNISGEYPGGGSYTAYILANKANGVGFYLFDDSAGKDIPAHKAFLAVPGANAAPFFGFADAETTGIHSLTPALSEGEGVYYTLDGRRVEKPTKGLYIVNGKKVLVP